MHAETDDWADLRSAWQAQPAADNDLGARKAHDLTQELARDVARGRVRMRAEMLAEWAVALGSAALFLWWAAGATGISRLAFIGLAMLAIASCAVTSHLRRQLWQAQAATVAAYRQLLRRRARLGLALARLGLWGGPVGVATGLLLGQGIETSQMAAAPLATRIIMLLAGLVLVAGWAWCWQQARHHRAQLARLDAAERD